MTRETPRRFDKVLVANRGEIAVRVIQAARELGLETVAVYSEPDRVAPHVLAAGEAVAIGPAPAAESYLDVDRLLAAAERTGAGAVHPGYGFLAENSAFARAVQEAGLAFVGPSSDAIAAMGDKTEARRRMREAGVPVIPGSETSPEDVGSALETAETVGYPVMLKAAAGGGGKGMRVVRSEEELAGAFRGARSEARHAFGDDRVYMERFLPSPRHIEIQILADEHGTTVHLGERECSIQRRHQKLVEEAPSPAIDAEARERMGEVAVAAAEAVDYVGAGTVEFLWEDGEFFFLEMNTRIQVEHPVTEAVTDVDLVQEQLRVAQGRSLGWRPSPDWPGGHAIECRISGEDPFGGFLPATGTVGSLRIPSGPGVRWDGGIAPGSIVGLHYDPLLAKLIVHAGTREAAIRRMRRALDELVLTGVSTTVPFHRAVMREPDFTAGRMTIHYVDEHPDLLEPELDDEDARWTAAAAALLEEERKTDVRRSGDRGGDDRGGDGRTSWQRAFDPS